MKTKFNFRSLVLLVMVMFLSKNIQAQLGATHKIQNNKSCDVWVLWETVDVNDWFINGVALPNFVVIPGGSSITISTTGAHDIYVTVVGEAGMTPAQAYAYHQGVNGNIVLAPSKPHPNDGGSSLCNSPWTITWTTAQTTIN